nr:uncharacterized protein LOC117833901 isoform X3 [Setaria viridis]
MAELISSAIVQETVGQILSGLVQKYEEKEESNEKRNLERLEMAHIRLEAALETSNNWQITDASLLRWRRKLKRAAQECDDTLHKCKQRILEDEQMEREVEKPCMSTWRSSMRRRSTSGGARKRKVFQGDDEELIRRRIYVCHWLDSWFTYVPVWLQRSLMNWIRKEKEILIAAPQLHLKF